MESFRDELAQLRRRHYTREEMRQRFDRFADLPLALASIAMVLLSIVQINGDVAPRWQPSLTLLQTILWSLFVLYFVIQMALTTDRIRYLRRHWLNALIVLVPFLGFLRLLALLRVTQFLPIIRLLLFGSSSLSLPILLLRRRRLGQLVLVSVLVALIGATLAVMLEARAPHANITNFGDALYWSATTVATIGSSYQPVTAWGRILAVFLMLYGIGVFSYVTASIASIFVGVDSEEPVKPRRQNGVMLSPQEIAVLRRILEQAERTQANG